jgi:hypothetical protein
MGDTPWTVGRITTVYLTGYTHYSGKSIHHPRNSVVFSTNQRDHSAPLAQSGGLLAAAKTYLPAPKAYLPPVVASYFHAPFWCTSVSRFGFSWCFLDRFRAHWSPLLTLGLSPHVIAWKIKSYFGDAEQRVQPLELLQTTVLPKLKELCSKLVKYSLPWVHYVFPLHITPTDIQQHRIRKYTMSSIQGNCRSGHLVSWSAGSFSPDQSLGQHNIAGWYVWALEPAHWPSWPGMDVLAKISWNMLVRYHDFSHIGDQFLTQPPAQKRASV